mmetsp:Transcript_18124/g.18332  ORF Transcript_18124/g.18332 Transcript_18124/m.18332 type:complete len:89 (-) Transcript_18124:169-435(-)
MTRKQTCHVITYCIVAHKVLEVFNVTSMCHTTIFNALHNLIERASMFEEDMLPACAMWRGEDYTVPVFVDVMLLSMLNDVDNLWINLL